MPDSVTEPGKYKNTFSTASTLLKYFSWYARVFYIILYFNVYNNVI